MAKGKGRQIHGKGRRPGVGGGHTVPQTEDASWNRTLEIHVILLTTVTPTGVIQCKKKKNTMYAI